METKFENFRSVGIVGARRTLWNWPENFWSNVEFWKNPNPNRTKKNQKQNEGVDPNVRTSHSTFLYSYLFYNCITLNCFTSSKNHGRLVCANYSVTVICDCLMFDKLGKYNRKYIWTVKTNKLGKYIRKYIWTVKTYE